MTTTKRTFLVIVMSVVISGCATVPSAQQLANANYGTPVTQENAEAQIKELMGRYLKDPYSAQYRFTPVEKGWWRDFLYDKDYDYGYVVNADINSKNSFGAYVGYKRYQFFFYNGMLVKQAFPQ